MAATAAPAEAAQAKPVFHEVYFAVIPSADFTQSDIDTAILMLESNGAVHCELSSTESELKRVTHLIAKTSDFPAYQDAIDAFIHVVTPAWIQQSLLKGRASNPRPFTPDPKNFLSNTIITIADDIPDGDRNAIIGGIMAFGGQFSTPLTKLCTHVIASSTNNQWCRLVMEKRLRCVMVLPHWFDHCMKLGKRIDTTPYQLPDPPLLKLNTADKVKVRENPDLKGCTEPLPSPPTSPSKHRRDLDVWRNKKILLADDLNLSKHVRKSIENVIMNAGGALRLNIIECDIMICQYREGTNFEYAVRNSLDVGNLSWFYWVTQRNQWTAPTRRLLHFPIPKEGLSEFKNKIITVSNYTGDARQYLENLITAAGAKFTKTLSQENTHLITAHTVSDKCDAAREWGVEIVNHLWLEDSYATCQAQTLSNPKYTTFPSKTNLGEIVGQVSIEISAIKQAYLQTIAASEEGTPPPSSNPDSSPPVRRVMPTRVNTPVHKPEGKENEVPASDGRGAKSRALNKLHQMAPDIALYEKESKRKGGVIYGGRRVADSDRVPLGSKRRSDAGEDGSVTGGAQEQTPKKKLKKDSTDLPTKTTSSSTLRVLCTGIEIPEATMTKLRHTPGIRLVDNPPPRSSTAGLDIVVTKATTRTKKLIASIPHAPTLVDSTWIDKVLKSKGSKVTTDDHIISQLQKDDETLDMSQAISRAQTYKDRGGLLKDWTIYLATTTLETRTIDDYEDIVSRNGGKALRFQGSQASAPKKRRRERAIIEATHASDKDDADDHEDGTLDMIGAANPQQKLILVSKKMVDTSAWANFQNMAADGGYEAVCVGVEWLIRVCVEQDLRVFEHDWLLAE